MFTKWITGLSILAIAVLASPIMAAELKVGDKAPEFSLKGEGADTVNLTDFKGKKLVLSFNRANWCPFCMKQVVDLQKNYDAIKDHGAELLIVWREEATGSDGLKTIRERTNATMPFALDLEAEKTGDYSPEGFDTYVIDEEGKIAAVLDGTKKKRAMSDLIIESLKKN
ncbi:peroxiredoxin family protein [Bremerella alba]|uniref:Peroxiredoxin Bcp n=1 Tax=Bremerella alba TaxID=980252 RepID=A0A7V8V9D7_9BACT|nr:peroxiredoxin family protein [Bremerella alba]MBA2117301.1 Peroxiredoxin Bcp [Bremerella alba]